MAPKLINLIVCDSNYIVREALKSLIGGVAGFTINGEGKGAEDALILLQNGLRTDAILTEFGSHGPNEESAVTEIKRSFPAVKLIILSANDDLKLVSKALKLGFDGYLLKSIKSSELVFAIRHICSGEIYICSLLTKYFVNRLTALPDTSSQNDASSFNFSGRELEILTLISQGYTNAQISDMLFASRRTIENYRQGLIDKTGSRNIVSLVRFAILNGLIS